MISRVEGEYKGWQAEGRRKKTGRRERDKCEEERYKERR
jgi:hypothetical protein